ncbi:MAG: hypothetical protein EXQ74_05945 [Thermoleophilia bacterium]|nr:hypothetical protein [Thermoleophilia bacterium]
MTSRRARRIASAVASVLIVPVLSGCSAQLSQFIDIAPDGGGNLGLELRMDPAAQRALDLPAQLSAGTFEEFLNARDEHWGAPGNQSLPFLQRTEADGTVVLTSVRRLRAGTSQLDDLKSALGVLRPLQPILEATGGYWAAPGPGDPATPTRTQPTSGTAPGGEAQAGITGLPTRVPLQALLTSEFTPVSTDDAGGMVSATFSLASRGGVGDVLDATCNPTSKRVDATRADTALVDGLDLTYRWGMPSAISVSSTGARLSDSQYGATWTISYGACPLMDLSSLGAEDGRFVNGVIIGAALLFLILVFGWRTVTRRRATGSPGA